jgi:hypothetical protein
MRNLWWYPGTKAKALGLSIFWLCFMVIGLWLTISQAIPACGFCTWIFFFLALGYFLIWLFQRDADARIVAQARAMRYEAPNPDAYGVPAPRTTPGSSNIGLDFTTSPPPERV